MSEAVPASTNEVVEERPQLPTGGNDSYACLQCRKILSRAQWVTEGCRECGVVAEYDINEVATKKFINSIGIIDAERSWVARVIQKEHCPNGVYAEAISEEENDEEMLEGEGHSEFQRDVDDVDEINDAAKDIEARYK